MTPVKPLLITALALAGFTGVLSAENFTSFKKGAFTSLKSAEGAWQAAPGAAEIIDKAGSSAALRFLGSPEGKTARVVTLTPAHDLSKGGMLAFKAERWTKRGPFTFTIEALDASGRAIAHGAKSSVLFDGEKTVAAGALQDFSVMLPPGTKSLRFTNRAPEGGGLILTDVLTEQAKPMQVVGIEVSQSVTPVLTRKSDNPVVNLSVKTKGLLDPVTLRKVRITLKGTDDLGDIAAVRLVSIGAAKEYVYRTNLSRRDGYFDYKVIGEVKNPTAPEFEISGDSPLGSGDNQFCVFVELKPGASLDRHIDAGILSVGFSDGRTLVPADPEPAGRQRIGVAVRLSDDDRSTDYRIPGLVQTKKGTLVGVYDIRYDHGGDLPANIDVGVSRSTDGGQTWGPMLVGMDMGTGGKDGVGDPAILVDEVTGRLWIAALWSHGNRAWSGSGKGMTPAETAQLMLAYSDDDGLTWSKPINITKQVKNPDWHMLFNGPGMGITLKDGTLVFPVQYQDGDLHPNGRKKGTPFASLIYSKDRGKTWHIGTGVKSNTTEAQVVELADGSVMINSRDNRGAWRTVGVTKDLGKTWELHETDRTALPDPVCMGSIIRVDSKEHGPLLVFSNPNTHGGRRNMTVKVSKDMGKTWPEAMHTLYDSRRCSGYSCLAPVGEDSMGVLYEGHNELYFLRFKIDELVNGKKD